jgi:LacI family transcriptional regulator
MRTTKRMGLKDVARVSGLSQATVSRYLNGSIVLPEATVARIESAIRECNYTPHAYARRLSLGRSDVIGLILPDISNAFFGLLAASVEAEAATFGLSLFLSPTSNSRAREIECLQKLRESLVDGVIFATNTPDDGSLARVIADVGPNIVLVDEDVPGVKCPKIFSDNRQGGRLAAQHFVERGHRYLAYVAGPAELLSTVERGSGFKEIIAAAGLPEPVVMAGNYSVMHGEKSLSGIVSRYPQVTGVFAGSDEIMIGMLRELRRVPQETAARLSIITFDDVGPLDLISSGITAVRQDVKEIGRRAVRALVSQMRPTEVDCPKLDAVPVELVSRNSVNKIV